MDDIAGWVIKLKVFDLGYGDIKEITHCLVTVFMDNDAWDGYYIYEYMSFIQDGHGFL